MLCPKCGYNGELIEGSCPRCGYGRTPARPVYTLTRQNTFTPPIAQTYVLSRGDILSKGRYRLHEQIVLPENQRHLARAWLANDMQFSHKVIVRELLSTESYQHHGEEYIRSAALQFNEFAKQERSVPQILDVFREQGRYFIVLEHTEGNSLATLIEQQGGALPERIVAEYGRQMCQLLTNLSTLPSPIVHGSISPHTIIVSPDSSYVSLIHFPILPAAALTSKSSSSSSAGYSAPEQVRGTVGPSTDLYSLAATLHYAVTGYNPEERMNFFYPPARRLNPAVTVQLEAVLARQLRLSVAQRYPDAAMMLHDLDAFIANYSHEDSHTPLPQDMVEFTNSSLLKKNAGNSNLLDIGVFAAITVLVLIGLMFFLLH